MIGPNTSEADPVWEIYEGLTELADVLGRRTLPKAVYPKEANRG